MECLVEISSRHLGGSFVLLNLFRVESRRTRLIGPGTINMTSYTKKLVFVRYGAKVHLGKLLSIQERPA